ncbi:MAG: hypothetical protein HYW33_03460 [Candidatus Blackburnbacteria bacterium]|nr:hypothetical protein [Candidatus Blackburnbacteria bacterium]
MTNSQHQKGPNLLLFAIFTTITIFVWISTEVYQILQQKSFENIPPAVLDPLSPSLNTKILEDLESKKYFPTNNQP